MSVLDQLTPAPADPILGMTDKFNRDTNPAKVNLGVGVYLDKEGRLPLPQSVARAEKILADRMEPRGYLPIDGLAAYIREVQKMIFEATDDRIVTVQTLSGTGALKTGADLLATILDTPRLLIPDPSWENHRALFSRAGFDVSTYRYYDAEAHGIDVDGLLTDLSQATANTVVIFHACCHNPTGYDLDRETWTKVADLCAERSLIPFIDMAYQGFSSSLNEDSWVPRLFASRCHDVFVASSFSKNMGLYGERIGSLSVVCRDSTQASTVRSRLKTIIRTTYSNPPTHGAKIVTTVLTDPSLRADWEEELNQMRLRMTSMRSSLVDALHSHGIEDMDFITAQVGMFSYCGLSAEQMKRLREEFSIYGLDSGRICMAGLNDSTVEQVAEAIASIRR